MDGHACCAVGHYHCGRAQPHLCSAAKRDRDLCGRISAGKVPSDPHDRIHRPIDGFFDSLGSSLRERCAGVILSGAGSDKALGLKAIKECGGLTIAQGHNGTAPQYGEMPAGAIATGVVDLVVPAE